MKKCSTKAGSSSSKNKKTGESHKPELPEIFVNDRQLPDMTRDALEALRKANDPPFLFLRSGQITAIQKDEKGRNVIVKVNYDLLKGIIARTGKFFRTYFDRNKDERIIECPPSKDLTKDVAVMNPSLLGLPPLEGLIEVPALRPDGSILQSPGYDRSTGLVYLPDPKLKILKISDSPTSKEVKKALNIINETIIDFPFNGQESRANAVAGLLTPLTRPAIHGPVPLLLVDATTQGTGKTLYCEVISITATGRAASLLSPPHDKEEWRRALTSILLEGRNIAAFDNVTQPLNSGELCKAITAEFWTDRLVGTSAAPSLPVRCMWIANGNNLQLGGDMARRCYLVRMDAKCSRPFERGGFKHPDLKKWVKDNRGLIVWALLTLARSWYVANCPQPSVPLLGSFEEWTRICGGVLENSGISGFLGNRTELYEHADQESSQWESFLLALFEYTAGKPFRLAEIEHELHANRRLSDTLPDEIASFINKPGSLTRKLGSAFSEKRGRRFGDSGVFVEREGVYQHAILWKVTCPHPLQR